MFPVNIQKGAITKKRILLAILAVVFIIFALFFWGKIFNSIVFSFGESTPYKLFVKIKGEPELYDYLLVKTPATDRFAKGRLVTKRVSCLPGMYLKIAGLDYYCCNGTPEVPGNVCIHLGRAKLFSLTGEKVTPFNPCGSNFCVVRVLEGRYFLVNPHSDSYDSRYLGFIGNESIVARLKPIW